MTLPSTGTISASMINQELGRAPTAPFSINGTEERQLAGKPSGAAISFADFRGKTARNIVDMTVGRSYFAGIARYGFDVSTGNETNIGTLHSGQVKFGSYTGLTIRSFWARYGQIRDGGELGEDPIYREVWQGEFQVIGSVTVSTNIYCQIGGYPQIYLGTLKVISGASSYSNCGFSKSVCKTLSEQLAANYGSRITFYLYTD